MFPNITMFIFLFLFISLINANMQQKSLQPEGQPKSICKCMFISLLLWVLIINIINSEYFMFEVTPWKKSCSQPHPYRCQGCCLPGYHGKPINFEYTGDKERAEARVQDCQMRDPSSLLKNNPDSYLNLQNTYFVPTQEDFKRGTYKNLDKTWGVVQENYGGCNCGGNVVEGYEGGCDACALI